MWRKEKKLIASSVEICFEKNTFEITPPTCLFTSGKPFISQETKSHMKNYIFSPGMIFTYNTQKRLKEYKIFTTSTIRFLIINCHLVCQSHGNCTLFKFSRTYHFGIFSFRTGFAPLFSLCIIKTTIALCKRVLPFAFESLFGMLLPVVCVNDKAGFVFMIEFTTKTYHKSNLKKLKIFST